MYMTRIKYYSQKVQRLFTKKRLGDKHAHSEVVNNTNADDGCSIIICYTLKIDQLHIS